MPSKEQEIHSITSGDAGPHRVTHPIDYGATARLPKLPRVLQQISERLLNLNQGTLYPALVRLEQYGWIKGNLGKDREQPGSQILRDHQGRTEGFGRRDAKVEKNVGSGGATSA